jgi:hypothetical protein
MTPSDLASWIRQARTKGAERFILKHCTWNEGGEGAIGIRTYEAQAGDPKEMADDAIAFAREDAKDTGGQQRYALTAWKEGEQFERKLWRVSGERTSDEGSLSEPPNATGVLAQAMRHYEARERMAVQKDSATFGTMIRIIDRLQGENTALHSREFENLKLREELLTKAHERTIELIQENNRAELKHRILTRAEPLIAGAASKLLGMPLAPGAEASSALDAFLASIRPEQVERMIEAKVLDPEQFFALQMLFKEGSARAEKREELLKKQEAERAAASTAAAGDGKKVA